MSAIAPLLLLAAIQATSEANHVQAHCKGEIEVVLGDKTRVDCLTETVAWEYDFGPKWAESVGQALHYARMTDRLPGVVLIVRKPSECRHLGRIEAIRDTYLPQLQIATIGARCPRSK